MGKGVERVVGGACERVVVIGAAQATAREDRQLWVYLLAGLKKFAFDYAVGVVVGNGVSASSERAVLRVLEGTPVHHMPLMRE